MAATVSPFRRRVSSKLAMGEGCHQGRFLPRCGNCYDDVVHLAAPALLTVRSMCRCYTGYNRLRCMAPLPQRRSPGEGERE